MAGEHYRFIPMTKALNAFFDRYERERRLSGTATGLAHVSPQQRIDTIVTMLGLNASQGWRRDADQSAEQVWLRYLTPVLAETRESAAALHSAAAGGLPGHFVPEMPAVQPRPDDRDPLRGNAWAPPEAEPWWRRTLSLAGEYTRTALRDVRLLGLAGVVLIAAATGYWVLSPPSPGPEVPRADPTVTPEPALPGVFTVQPTGETGSDDPLDEAGKDYRAALGLTILAVAEERQSITPYELAELYAGESASSDDPAVFLAAMMRDWPLPPSLPVSRDRSGAYALTRYAATFAVLERGDAFGLDRPALDRQSTEDIALRSTITAFGVGDDASVPPDPAPLVAASWPDWLRWLAFLPLLGLFAWTRFREVSAFKAQLVNPQAGALGIKGELPAETLTLTDPLPARRLVRQISWREPGLARRIHTAASIRRTIRNGGYLTLVPRLRRRTADFLFLVPRLRDNDHEHQRVGRLIESLRRGGLNIAAYDYYPDPRTLYPRPTEGAAAAAVLDLRALRERHAESRLVLVTDGAELVDFFTQRPLPLVAGDLATWSSKMLLTPVPMAEWGEREMNLSEALDAAIGRAGPDSFADLMVAFGEHPRAAPRSARPVEPRTTEAGLLARVLSWLGAAEALLGAGPESVRRPTSARFNDPVLVSDAAPPDDDQRALIGELRAWLGPLGFLWLSACAAYPQLRFAITLYLGLRLTIDRGPVSEPLFTEARLAQLTLLPWFRNGRMPPWLRQALFAALPPPHRARIRRAVDDMLNGTAHGDLGQLPPEARLPIWRQETTGYDIPADAVMADLLFRDRTEIDPVIKGGAFSAIFRDVALRAQQTSMLVLGAGFIACLMAFFLFPSSGPAPQPAGQWLPLLGYLVVIALIAGVVGIVGVLRRPAPSSSLGEVAS